VGVAALAWAVAGALAVERKGALQLMLARPLVLAPLLGFALGDAEAGLALGVPLELLTLGGVSLGASLPDNETLLAAALVSFVVPAGIQLGATDEPLAALGLLLLVPLGPLGQRLERWSEERNVALAERADQRLAEGDLHSARVNLRGLLGPFVWTGAICAACVLASPFLAWLRSICPERLETGLRTGWHLLWALSAAAAVRAIRDSRAPALSMLSAAAVAVALVVLWRFG
jgi:PTS system mannose-specific IIC component